MDPYDRTEENARIRAQRTHEDGTFFISAQEAADLACQTAWRRSRNNAAKMRQLLQNELENSIFSKVPGSGGAFEHPTNACHPDVPGCNYFMAYWYSQYLDALRRHIEQIL